MLQWKTQKNGLYITYEQPKTLHGSGVLRVGLEVSTPPPLKFRSFDKVKPDCKLSGKCLVFLFQRPN